MCFGGGTFVMQVGQAAPSRQQAALRLQLACLSFHPARCKQIMPRRCFDTWLHTQQRPARSRRRRLRMLRRQALLSQGIGCRCTTAASITLCRSIARKWSRKAAKASLTCDRRPDRWQPSWRVSEAVLHPETHGINFLQDETVLHMQNRGSAVPIRPSKLAHCFP